LDEKIDASLVHHRVPCKPDRSRLFWGYRIYRCHKRAKLRIEFIRYEMTTNYGLGSGEDIGTDANRRRVAGGRLGASFHLRRYCPRRSARGGHSGPGPEPCIAERAHLIGHGPTGLLEGHDRERRVLGEGDRGGTGLSTLLEGDLDAVARGAGREDGGDVGLGGDIAAVES